MGNILKGRVWKFGNNIDTDVIIPYKYKARTLDVKELAQHCMEGLDPGFSKKVQPGDFIVASRNFGCGSSREQAPIVIKGLGISAVIAETFARIFYRNAINIGLPVLEVKGVTQAVDAGDVIEVDLSEGVVTNTRSGAVLKGQKLPKFLEGLVKAGGLVEYYKAHKKFPWQ